MTMPMASWSSSWSRWWWDVVGFLEYEFIKNKKFIIVPSKKWYSQHMNNTGTCPDIDSDFLKYPNWPSSWWWWSMDDHDGTWKISYKTGIALISDRHLSPPTLCIYPALATHHGICNRHEPGAWHIGEKVNLPREQKWTVLAKNNKDGRHIWGGGSTTGAIWWLCSTGAIWWL